MKRTTLFIILFLSVCPFILPQTVVVKDTINVVVLQDFTLPKIGAIVLGQITGVNSITGELLDSSFTKVRDVEKITQKPLFKEVATKATGGRGIPISMVFHENIDKVGAYYLKANINCRGEGGNSIVTTAYYLINVDYPTIAAPINLRKDYFNTEKESFGFATTEYSDTKLYAYTIAEGSGSALVNGSGPLVKLDDLFADEKNVGKKFVITGFYNGKEIYFKDPVAKDIKKADWTVNLVRPQLNAFNGWQIHDEKQKQEDRPTWALSLYNEASKRFAFSYFGFVPGGFVAILPKITNLSVTSTPPEFLKDKRKGVWSKLFASVEIEPNPTFMSAMKPGESVDVRVKIQFATQFEQKVVKEYRATIIK